MAREVTNHGRSGYRQGCKCEVCRAAKREYMRGWRARQKAAVERTDAPGESASTTPTPAPVAAAGSLDMTAPAGPLEQAFLEDLREPDDRVAFRRHLVGIGRLNARVLDQIGTLDRLDLVSPVQLRQLEVLQRLALLGFAGLRDDDDEGEGDLAADAAAMLADIAQEGGAGGSGWQA
ncbi:hypothetical protein [Actinotalea sp. JY-7876]|uniref:hypothetical protein n=1 Tax=Actinotalea sp. JY-7876 TaxID=2758442 RepID=UPI0015F740DC|nr:hypothetical protein [Actinotalea sp. JY-7876]